MKCRRIATYALTLALAALAPCPASGQGVGSPNGFGEVPRIEVDHYQVGSPNRLVLTGSAPGSPLVIMASGSATAVPLASFGWGPAVLGPDLASPLGSAVVTGPSADANGELILAVPISPALTHVPMHLQFASIDPGAPHGGVSFSEHRNLIFGQERDRHPLAVEVNPGRYLLAEIFAYGVLAAPIDPRLANVSFHDLILANSNELAFSTTDRPVVDTLDPFADAVVLPDGSRLYAVRSPTLEDGLVRIGPDGRIDVLIWAQGTAIDPAFAREIAVSAYDPYLAVAAETPLPEYGGARLLLVRTDGRNIPFSHLGAVSVPVPAGLIDVESSPLAFLDGALFFGDGATQLHRLDLAVGGMTQVVFPPSGGSTPAYLDEQYSIAEQGGALAMGAGQSDVLHDIYVVSAAGVAVNVTNNPSDYEDAGAGQADGMQLAIDAAGNQVAYMRTVIETETFVQNVPMPLPEAHITNPTQYIDSIDTVVGLDFKTGLVFVAGKDENASDVYHATVPPGGGAANQISNVTATSGATSPPFGLGATLELRRKMNVGPALAYDLINTGGADVLQIVDGAATLTLDEETVVAHLPLPAGLVLVDHDAANVVRIRTVTTTPSLAVTATWTSGVAATLTGRAVTPAGGCALMVSSPSGSTLVIVDAAGQLTPQPGPIGAPQGALAVDSSDRVIASTVDTSGNFGFERFDPVAGAWSFLITPSGPAGGMRFLR